MTEKVDGIVIGAGVIGLATARALAQRGMEVLVLERHTGVGQETSSRNSGIIHAGIYYPNGSLKARLCVSGKQALYRYCNDKAVPWRQCGKLLLATSDEQIGTLRALDALARRNGVADLQWLSSDDVRAREPDLRAIAALWSPSSGIVDTHALLQALTADVESAGGVIACHSPFVEARVMPRERGGGYHVIVGHGPDQTQLQSRFLINCAGLHASQVAGHIRGLDSSHVPQTRFAKGNYFVLQGKSPFTHLAYPIPEQAGLGIHLTLDLGGQAFFGPDVEWLPALPDDTTAYRVDSGRIEAFRTAIRQYWPGVDDVILIPGQAGVRPKLCREGEPPADFSIQGPSRHGLPGLINLFGIESPGLTACLTIADEVLTQIDSTS